MVWIELAQLVAKFGRIGSPDASSAGGPSVGGSGCVARAAIRPQSEPVMPSVPAPNVAAFMTPVPETILEDLMVSDALDRMYNDNLRHLPVVNGDGGLVGILSTRDVALSASLFNVDPERSPVSAVMSRQVYSVKSDTPIDEVALIMERDRLGSTVVTEGNKPVGIFTTTDAMRVIRQLVAGEPVKPAMQPDLTPDPDADAPRQVHGHRRPHGASKYDGMVSWFFQKI